MNLLFVAAISVVAFLLGVAAVWGANAAKKNRYTQLALPLIAFIYGLIALWNFTGFYNAVQQLTVHVTQNFSPLASLLNSFGAPLTSAVLNFLLLLGFAGVKELYNLAIRLLGQHYDRGLQRLIRVFYVYDDECSCWFLRDSLLGVQRLLRNLYRFVLVASSLFFAASFIWPGSEFFLNPFYPAFAVLIIGEIYYALQGQSRGQYMHGIEFEGDGSQRIFQYAKLQEALQHYFSDRILHKGTRGARQQSESTQDDFCDALANSDDPRLQLVATYFKSLIERGVLARNGQSARYDELNRDMALTTARMMQGKSVLFASPFYRDSVPYVFLPLVAQLMRGNHALVLYGPEASEAAVRSYVEEGLEFSTGIPGMWSIGSLAESANENCDVALVPFYSLGNLKSVKDAEDYLGRVGFVIVVDPAGLLATYQIGLNYLSEYITRESPATYCIFGRNSDGLIDSLSHALRIDLTEVVATEYAEAASVYMVWDVDGEGLQHRLMPGVAQYLGIGTEIGLVALKGQISTTDWVSGSAAPLTDLRWIDGQYYGELAAFAELPQEQSLFDRSFEWFIDRNSVPKDSNRFIVVEDEYANIFETYRQFATRGTEQAFINILAPHYLMRDYMISNSELFTADPKAVPALAPDFAKSARNVIFSIVMIMAQTKQDMTEEDIAARLRYAGISFNNVHEALKGLLADHIEVPEHYQGVAPEDHFLMREVAEYDPVTRDFITRRYYRLSNSAMYSDCFTGLQNVPLVTELPDGSSQLLGARLYGHVYQQFLPGQFTVIDGKYYEVVSVSDAPGVILRRAADHYSRRRYYRSLQQCTLEGWVPFGEIGSIRTISSVIVQRVAATFSIATSGYLELSNRNNLKRAYRVELSDVPVRQYRNKAALRIEFPNATNNILRTLATIISEMMITLYPRDYPYILVATTASEGLEAGLLPEFIDCQTDDTPALYIFEDSLIDLGLISSIDRNIQRIFELAWEYVDWHLGQFDAQPEEEPTIEVGEEPPFTPPVVAESLPKRILEKIRNILSSLKKTNDPEDSGLEPSQSQDDTETLAVSAVREQAIGNIEEADEESIDSAATYEEMAKRTIDAIEEADEESIDDAATHEEVAEKTIDAIGEADEETIEMPVEEDQEEDKEELL